MRLVLLTFPLLFVAACAEEEEPTYPPVFSGRGSACLGSDDISQLPESASYEFTGVVHGPMGSELDFNLVPCDFGATHVVRAREASGADWIIGYRLADHTEADLAPATILEDGEEIEVIFRHVATGEKSAGFVIEYSGGGALVAAVEVASQGPALITTDIPDLEVKYGEWTGTHDTECGTQHGYQIEMHAETSVTMPVVSDAELQLRGSMYRAYAVSSQQYDTDLKCDGRTGELIWGLFLQ